MTDTRSFPIMTFVPSPLALLSEPEWEDASKIVAETRRLSRLADTRCPPKIAEELAKRLAGYTDSEAVEEYASLLGRLPRFVAEGIVRTMRERGERASADLVCYYGKEAMFKIDLAITRGQALAKIVKSR